MRRLLDRAVAASSNGIVITDPRRQDNPIIYVNPAFERTTGFPVEEVLGRNCRFLQGSDRDQPPLAELRDAIREGRECRVMLRNYRKNGEQFWNELYISPVYDEAGRLTNFIGVQNDVTERKHAEEERDLLLAREQLARAEAVAARRRLSLLAAAGTELSTSLDYAATLEKITRILVPDLAEWCLVDTESNGIVRQTAEAHADPSLTHHLRELRDLRKPEDAGEVQKNSPRFLSETEVDAEFPRLPREIKARSCMRVPLLARGRVLGAITLASTHPGRYDDEDLALAENLAHRCALALDNARLYGEQNYIARTLQQSLLPHLPEVPGVEVGAEYLPAGSESSVGGDFYDLIECGESGCWVATIGDVCGQGATAIATTALVRHTVRAVALLEDSPVRILSDLNEAMLQQFSAHQFCTAACVCLRYMEDGAELTVARGGHPSPLLLRASGAVEKVGHPGRAIGVFEDLELDEEVVRLGSGDALVLYTDGVTEARSPDEDFFGENRLVDLLGFCAGMDASGIAEKIKDAVLRYAGETPHDDIAVLVLQVPG